MQKKYIDTFLSYCISPLIYSLNYSQHLANDARKATKFGTFRNSDTYLFSIYSSTYTELKNPQKEME